MGESDGARQLKMQANQTGIESWEETREGWIKADVVFSNLPHVEANLLEPPPGQNPAYRDVDLFDVEEGVWRGASFLQSISEVENRRAEEDLRFAENLQERFSRKVAMCIIAAIFITSALFVGAAFGTSWFKHSGYTVVYKSSHHFEADPPPISTTDGSTEVDGNSSSGNSTTEYAAEWSQPSSPTRALTYSPRFSSSR
eukprot:1384293-Rhodomonas_salina.1